MAESIKKFIIKDAHGGTKESGSFSVVGEVHVNIVPGYGEPYADSEYVNGILTITIHNIEGNGITEITTDSQEGDEAVNTVTIKTNANPEGVTLDVRNGSRGNGIASSSEVLSPEDGGTNTHTLIDTDGNEHVFHTRNGSKGDKGDQGDSAIWTGEGEPWSGLKNTTGQSTTEPMTQKAVTDELLVVDKEYKAGYYATYPQYIDGSTGKWSVEQQADRTGCAFVPVEAGGIIRLTAGEYATGYAFLKTDSHSPGVVPDFCDGTTNRLQLTAGETITLAVPSDAHYLYVLVLSAGNDVNPLIFWMKKISSVNTSVDYVEKNLRWHAEELDLSNYGFVQKYIGRNSEQWTTGSANAGGIFIPVVPGQIMRLQGAGAPYAFLKSTDTQTVGQTPQYAGGATQRSSLYQRDLQSPPEVYIVQVPQDASHLWVMTKSAGVSLEFRGWYLTPTAEQVANVSANGAYMMPVDCIEEYEHCYFNWDGTIGYLPSSDPNYNLALFRKYAITQGNDYYATARLGGGAIKPIIAYYDVNEEFIGFDPYFAATNTVRVFMHEKMNIPDNAAYCIIAGTIPNIGSVSSPIQPNLYIGTWQSKKDITPLVIEMHEAKIQVNTLVSNKDSDPTAGSKIVPTEVSSPWAVMWPSSYTPFGKPTQVIAMLHGSEGVVRSGVMGYTNANWIAWRNRYITEGYAVVDINGIGVTSGSADSNSKHFGCPAAVETLDKAFEYLKANYNVADKLHIHGTSMGGALAQTYAKTYPEKVLAVAVFAPAVLFRSAAFNGNKDIVAQHFGYADHSEAKADGYANMFGVVPFMKCLAWHNGEIVEVSWEDVSGNDEAFEYLMMEKFPVPIRCWQGMSDATVPPDTNKHVIDGYRRGGSQASIRLIQGGTHDISTGNTQYVVDEAVEYFKRYGG